MPTNSNINYKSLAEIFKKPFGYRTREERNEMIEFLLSQKYLRKKYEELRKYSRDNDKFCPSLRTFMEDISRVFKTKEFKKGSLLFHLGEDGKECIVILKGAIECAIPKTDVERNMEEKRNNDCVKLMLKHKTYKIYKKKELLHLVQKQYSKEIYDYVNSFEQVPETLALMLAQPAAFTHITDADMIMLGLEQNRFTNKKDQQSYHNKNIFVYKRVFTAKSGDVIGEMALEKKEKRAATCFTSQKTIAITMEKNDFNLFFENAKKDDTSKIDFLEEYFGKLPQQKMKNFSYLFDEKNYERGNVLFRQGAPIKKLYFMHIGEIDIIKKQKESKEKFGKMLVNEEADINFEQKVEDLKIKTKKKTELNLVKVAILGNNTCLGDFDFFKSRKSEKKFYSFSAIVKSSEAVVYELRVEDLNNAFFLLGHYKLLFMKKSYLKRKFLNERLEMSIAPETMIRNFYEEEKLKEFREKRNNFTTLRKTKLVLNKMKRVEPKNILKGFLSEGMKKMYPDPKKGFRYNSRKNYLFGISKEKKIKEDGKFVISAKKTKTLDEYLQRRKEKTTRRLHTSHFMPNEPVKLSSFNFFTDDILRVKGEKFRDLRGFAYGSDKRRLKTSNSLRRSGPLLTTSKKKIRNFSSQEKPFRNVRFSNKNQNSRSLKISRFDHEERDFNNIRNSEKNLKIVSPRVERNPPVFNIKDKLQVLGRIKSTNRNLKAVTSLFKKSKNSKKTRNNSFEKEGFLCITSRLYLEDSESEESFSKNPED